MLNNIEKIIGLNEASIVNIDQLVAWKKSKKLYNFEILPKTAILTVFPSKKSVISSFFSQKIKGIKGENYILNRKKYALYADCSYGAPHVISLCEELRALGVSNFVFIGLAGAIVNSHQVGELLYVEKAYSGV